MYIIIITYNALVKKNKKQKQKTGVGGEGNKQQQQYNKSKEQFIHSQQKPWQHKRIKKKEKEIHRATPNEHKYFSYLGCTNQCLNI